jgi:ABC-type polysaccharide/polyol phosphate transport system ATPase subunit
MPPAVAFQNVTKRYMRGDARYASLRAQLADTWSRTGMRLRRQALPERGTPALEDVSFALEEGESVALVGPNGAGKTTALKLLSRISYPSSGHISVRGRIAALIEVGSGLHPELTGRENVHLFGRILGMSRPDIARRFDQIVDFAEISHALERPVKMYSSGMELRLGFAIASHLDPEIFVVDEALAVGDAGFQVKCVERMSSLVREGRTLLFVSHDLPAAEALCSRAIFLNQGRLVEDGPARAVIARYLAWTDEQRHHVLDPASQAGRDLRIVGATLHDLSGEERYAFRPGEGLELRLRFEGERVLRRPHVNVGISDGRAGLLVQCSMLHDGEAPERVGPNWECRCRIDQLPLRPRLYQVFCDVYGESGHGVLTEWSQVSSFRVEGTLGAGPLAVSDLSTSGPVDVPYSWRVDEAGDA